MREFRGRLSQCCNEVRISSTVSAAPIINGLLICRMLVLIAFCYKLANKYSDLAAIESHQLARSVESYTCLSGTERLLDPTR
jgi:hypothetical protein